jgi:tetratricopeptide (TPR) repeat protein
MDIKFVADCHAAIELVYQRKYSEAKIAFEAAQRRYPGSALGPIGHVLIYQALMLENLDFSYERQYTLAANQARQQLMEALEVRGNDAWEHFILGGVLGVDAIHSMRRGNYLTSLNRALEAMKSIERAKKLAPEFPDLKLGDGLYNYWRTVISRGVKGLPDFADNRMLGIEQLREVQEKGIFLGPAATFALTYTWLEEGALKRATQSALRNHRAYPENVVNNLMLGRLYMYRRKYTESEKYFEMVVRVSPQNRRVYYFMTRMYLRQKRLADAETSVNRFLAFDLSKRERALALMQKSLIYYRRADWDTAEALAQKAWTLGKLKRAKRRLSSINRARERAVNKVDAAPPPPPPVQSDAETTPSTSSTPKAAKAAKAGRKK